MACFLVYVTGRVDIRLNIDIPMDTELVEPLQEGCIWRQARGSATVILGAEDVVGSSEKVPSCRAFFLFSSSCLTFHILLLLLIVWRSSPLLPVPQ
jgi:hypothetical protein